MKRPLLRTWLKYNSSTSSSGSGERNDAWSTHMVGGCLLVGIVVVVLLIVVVEVVSGDFYW